MTYALVWGTAMAVSVFLGHTIFQQPPNVLDGPVAAFISGTIVAYMVRRRQR